MIRTLAIAGAALLWAVTPASAHRLDEYLQAAMILVEKDRVQAQLYLTPGVAVSTAVIGDIDTNADGIISSAEQRAYTTRVLRDLSLTIDGEPLRLRLISSRFAGTEELQQGRGGIEMVFAASVRPGGPKRKLVFENHHQTRISAYLVNCLAPSGPDIRVASQKRNFEQSFYELDYEQAGVQQEPSVWWAGTAALLLLAPLGRIWRTRSGSAASQSGACDRALLNAYDPHAPVVVCQALTHGQAQIHEHQGKAAAAVES